MTKKRKKPSYLALHRSGTLQERALATRQLLQSCTVCPHACGINRLAGELGKCGIGARARVASFGAHYGEESPLVGRHGSGTIFFEGCNLCCLFCQNYDISQIDRKGDASPQAVDEAELAAIMLDLQAQGCHNINKVNTRATLWFDVENSPSLSDYQKNRIRQRLTNRISKDGVLQVTAMQHRTQMANREEALRRFTELLAAALVVKPRRKKTRISTGVKERRLQTKKRRGLLKSSRTKQDW